MGPERLHFPHVHSSCCCGYTLSVSLFGSGSQTLLHGRITWKTYNPNAQVALHSIWVRTFGGWEPDIIYVMLKGDPGDSSVWEPLGNTALEGGMVRGLTAPLVDCRKQTGAELRTITRVFLLY